MEYLQYGDGFSGFLVETLSFKPCYKWNTFNTWMVLDMKVKQYYGFKPCYKWNTFNTIDTITDVYVGYVLNLVINGIPSILYKYVQN